MSIRNQVHKEAMKLFLFFQIELTIYISIYKEHFVIKKEIELKVERQTSMTETRFCAKSLLIKEELDINYMYIFL